MFFRTGSDAGKPDGVSASAGTTQTTNAAAGAFNPMGAGPASTAAQPNGPTAIQNRQDQKDRVRGELDYEVNRRAEAEIQNLSRKLILLNDKLDDVDELLRKKQ